MENKATTTQRLSREDAKQRDRAYMILKGLHIWTTQQLARYFRINTTQGYKIELLNKLNK